MSEMPHSGEDHSNPETVSGIDDLLIAHRTSGLDDGRCANFGNFFDTVWEGKEGVGRGYCAFQGQLRLHGS